MKIKEIIILPKDGRQSFIESWLSESPMRISPTNYYPNLVSNINDFKKVFPIISLTDNWKKIWGKSTAYYWYEENEIILIGAEFEIQRESLIINFVAKNPELKGKPPYATELYNIVLKDLVEENISIRIDSDIKLSDEGFGIWQKLLAAGHTISVYDVNNPGTSFTKINNINQLKQYFDIDPSFQKYRYVLTETDSKSSANLHRTFGTKKFREENNNY